jgi:hypothetical protein
MPVAPATNLQCLLRPPSSHSRPRLAPQKCLSCPWASSARGQTLPISRILAVLRLVLRSHDSHICSGSAPPGPRGGWVHIHENNRDAFPKLGMRAIFGGWVHVRVRYWCGGDPSRHDWPDGATARDIAQVHRDRCARHAGSACSTRSASTGTCQQMTRAVHEHCSRRCDRWGVKSGGICTVTVFSTYETNPEAGTTRHGELQISRRCHFVSW